MIEKLCKPIFKNGTQINLTLPNRLDAEEVAWQVKRIIRDNGPMFFMRSYEGNDGKTRVLLYASTEANRLPIQNVHSYRLPEDEREISTAPFFQYMTLVVKHSGPIVGVEFDGKELRFYSGLRFNPEDMKK